MRKRKYVKICSIIIGVWIAFTVGRGFYWYYRFDGENFSMIISTQHSQTSVDIEVYLDDMLIFKDGNYLSIQQYVDATLPFGVYKLKAIIDKKEYIRHFILFPVKFLYIEISKDEVWYDKSGEASVIIDISSSPIGMM